MTVYDETPTARMRCEGLGVVLVAGNSPENKPSASGRQPRTVAKVAAERQAAQIHAYWQERGVAVDVWIEPLRVHSDRRTDWQVRSTLRVGGRP